MSGPEGTIFAQGDFAIVYMPVAEAQQATGRSGLVNDLVLTLAAGVDRAGVKAELES
ncbi:MAG: hypothetical protein GWO22_34745, partial [Actinobacteria bacterium]|nr:hypothetical protein [Actinomycetota bacterium]